MFVHFHGNENRIYCDNLLNIMDIKVSAPCNVGCVKWGFFYLLNCESPQHVAHTINRPPLPLWEGKPPVPRGFPSQRVSDEDLWYSVWVLAWMICRTNSVWWWFEILNHWGRVTHICVSKLTIIGSDNGLSLDRRQAIIWTNAGLLLIGPLGTNFSEILIEILTFSFKKMRLKMLSVSETVAILSQPQCVKVLMWCPCNELCQLWVCQHERHTPLRLADAPITLKGTSLGKLKSHHIICM